MASCSNLDIGIVKTTPHGGSYENSSYDMCPCEWVMLSFDKKTKFSSLIAECYYSGSRRW
jgi:hypothetical protein